MKLQKFRWSKVYESSEEELLEFMDARKIKGDRWKGSEFQEFGTQSFDEDTTVWCAEGSLTIRVAGDNVSVQPGDAVHIPANITYEMSAGISGCVCYESQRISV